MGTFNYPHYPDLKDRTVLITGGGSGIGASLTEAFTGQGSKVAFFDIQDEVSNELVSKQLTSNSLKPQFLKCDLTDIEALKKAVSEVEGKKYKDKLLKLPKFLIKRNVKPDEDSLKQALLVSGFFIDKFLKKNDKKMPFYRKNILT